MWERKQKKKKKGLGKDGENKKNGVKKSENERVEKRQSGKKNQKRIKQL